MEKFVRISALLEEEKFNKLKNASVAIVGLGGVGGTAAICLARCGVSNIIIQDYDIVCESNFNRQIISNINTLNMKKTKALKEMILNINPSCNVIEIDEKYDENSSLFSHTFDYLIDAIDSVDNKVLLIKNCLERNICFISSMGTAKKMDISKLSIMNINQTSYDPLAKVVRKKLRDNNIPLNFSVLSSKEEALDAKILGSYMPVTSSAGLMLADYIIKKIIER